MAVLARLDPNASKPLYQQLREALERSIAADHFPDGSLPSSRELAAELGISRNTVNLAYQELVAEGFVTSRPRSGLTVNEELLELLQLQREETAERPAGPDWAARLQPRPANPFHELKLPADWYTHAYPFLSGQVAVDLFPAREWLRMLRLSLEPEHRVHSLQDARFYDDPLLVHRLRTDILPSRGVEARPEEILVTSGSQEALHLIALALIRNGTRAAVENPGYADAHLVFQATGAELLPVPMDKSGLQMTRELERADIAYVTPSHQLPTCVTLSAGRRRRLLELADRNDLLIVEDDYDSELRYQGRPTPAMKAADPSGRVIYVGSFSKLLAPGLRLGFVVAPAELIANLREWRRITSRHPSGIIQRTLALFIESGGYQRWLRRHRGSLKRKWERVLDAAALHLPWRANPPTGGTGIWISGPPKLDTSVLAVKAARAGVLFEHGHPFYVREPRPKNTLRLGFVAIDEERIEPGIKALADAAAELPRRMKG